MNSSYKKPIKQLEAQLGLNFKGLSRSYTHHAQYRYDSPAADLLDRINNIKTRYVSYGLPAIRRSKGIRRKADELFHRLGPELWPDYEKSPSPSWLLRPFLELGDNEEENPCHYHYPRRLYYSSLSDRAILASTFYSLFCAKVRSYHGNNPKNLSLASDDIDPLDSECLPNSELSEYPESARSEDECDDESDYSATQSKRTKRTKVTPKTTGHKSMPPYVAPTAPMMGSEQSRARLAQNFEPFDGADQTLGQPSNHEKQNVASGVSRTVSVTATARQPFSNPSPTPELSRVATPTQNRDGVPERQKKRTGDKSVRGTKIKGNQNRTKPYLPPTCLTEDEYLSFTEPPQAASSSRRSSEHADRSAKRTGDETIQVANSKKSKLTEEVPQDPSPVHNYDATTEQPKTSKTTVPPTARGRSDNPTEPSPANTAADVRPLQGNSQPNRHERGVQGSIIDLPSKTMPTGPDSIDSINHSPAKQQSHSEGVGSQRQFDPSNERQRETVLEDFVAHMQKIHKFSSEEKQRIFADVTSLFGAESLESYIQEKGKSLMEYPQDSLGVAQQSKSIPTPRNGACEHIPAIQAQQERASGTNEALSGSAISTANSSAVRPIESADHTAYEHRRSVSQAVASPRENAASAAPAQETTMPISLNQMIDATGLGTVGSADRVTIPAPQRETAQAVQPSNPAAQSITGAATHPQRTSTDAFIFERICVLLCTKREPDPEPKQKYPISLGKILSKGDFWENIQAEPAIQLKPGEAIVQMDISRADDGPAINGIWTEFEMYKARGRDQGWDMMLKRLRKRYDKTGETFEFDLRVVVIVNSELDAKASEGKV